MPQCKRGTAARGKSAWQGAPAPLLFPPPPLHQGRGGSGAAAGGRPRVYAGALVKETGVRNGAVGADKFGFDGLEAVHWNLAEPPLYEFAIRAGEAELAYGGALCAHT